MPQEHPEIDMRTFADMHRQLQQTCRPADYEAKIQGHGPAQSFSYKWQTTYFASNYFAGYPTFLLSPMYRSGLNGNDPTVTLDS